MVAKSDDVVAKQFEAIRRSGLTTMIDRKSVQFWAFEAGYDELKRWMEQVSADFYVIKAEEFVSKYRGEDIAPYSAQDVLDAQDEVQQDAFKKPPVV